MTVDDVMSASPKSIAPETLVASALEMINSSSITTLMVVDGGQLVGLVHLHDLLRVGAA